MAAMVSLHLLVEVFVIGITWQMLHQEHPDGSPSIIGLLIFVAGAPVCLVDMLSLGVVSLDFSMEYDLFLQG